MMRLIKLASIGLAILLTGCASGVKYSDMATSISTVKPDQARIYFLRSNSMVGAALQPAINLDNAVVGDSKPGGFFYIDTTPGNHLVSTTTEVERHLTFALDAGETKYVKTSISMGLFVGHVTPELVSQDDAMTELPELKYTGTAGPTSAPATTMATRTPESTPSVTTTDSAPVTASVAAPVAEAAPTVTTVSVPQQQYAAPYTPSELRRPAASTPVAAASANPAPSAPVQTYSVPDNSVATSNNTQAYAAAAVSQPVSTGTFQLGVSSNTVEKMARQAGCESKLGAGLISESGPTENYRMNCHDGKVFVAHCEYRQCTTMQYQ